MGEGRAEFIVRYWGVRGSVPTPGPSTVRYGGNTTCLEICCDDQRIIIDTGTGARALGDALSESLEDPKKLHLIYSHYHLDHIQGFPFFAPIYNPDTQLVIHGGVGPDVVRRALETQMAYPNFPVLLQDLPAQIRFHGFEPGETLDLGGVQVETCPLNHPGGAVAYRINHRKRSFVQASDTEHEGMTPDPDLVALCRGADVLSYDSTYIEGEEFDRFKGWGHSTWAAGHRVADAAGVERFVVFHHEPSHSDDFMDQVAHKVAAVRPGTVVAREGMVLDLLAESVS